MIFRIKEYHNLTVLATILLTMFSVSCSSDLDFNQANNLKIKPVIVANLTYFDIAANGFLDNGIEQKLAFDAQDFDVFRDSFFRDSLKRADFFFEINNTINRAFTINIVLLDVNDQPLYNIPFVIPAYNGTSNTITQTEVFENLNLELLKSTKRMGFVIAMAPGAPLDGSSQGSLQLRSSATVYLEIQ
tara:strand:+ start:2922 stop:3485 length:564 start_codon:yes stop_codon:yes gene_type:complete